MKKNLVLSFVCLFLVSCNDIEGLLKVYSNFTLDADGQTFELVSGRSDASIKFKSDDHLQLKTIVDGERIQFDFKLARDYDFPKRNGRFSIPAEENSQGYDVEGEVRSVTERSRRYRDRESCTYTVYRTRCRNTRRGRICERYPVRRHGWRDVEYYDEITQRDLRVAIFDGPRELAEFSAEDEFRRRRDVYRGRCF